MQIDFVGIYLGNLKHLDYLERLANAGSLQAHVQPMTEGQEFLPSNNIIECKVEKNVLLLN